jgi:hypothetical protein
MGSTGRKILSEKSSVSCCRTLCVSKGLRENSPLGKNNFLAFYPTSFTGKRAAGAQYPPPMPADYYAIELLKN